MVTVYPKTINHIAVSVIDIDSAIKWYKEVFGFTLLKGPVDFMADESHTGAIVKDIHGSTFKKMKMAWLGAGNHVGFELIEYLDPKAEKQTKNFEYWKSGLLHLCITDPNIEELCKRICEKGGKQRTNIWRISPDHDYKIVFCEDPFGNIIEIYTHSYEHTVVSLF